MFRLLFRLCLFTLFHGTLMFPVFSIKIPTISDPHPPQSFEVNSSK